jgi:hypothetical protein
MRSAGTFAAGATWWSAIGERAVKLQSFVVLVAAAIGLASCSQEVVYTDQQRACIAKHYSDYDAGKLSQCVEVCKSCMTGNTVTCNTSCRLRGAN